MERHPRHAWSVSKKGTGSVSLLHQEIHLSGAHRSVVVAPEDWTRMLLDLSWGLIKPHFSAATSLLASSQRARLGLTVRPPCIRLWESNVCIPGQGGPHAPFCSLRLLTASGISDATRRLKSLQDSRTFKGPQKVTHLSHP